MTKEQRIPQPEGFRLTENEKLFDRISDARFQQLLFNDQTTIHNVKVDSNSYGEFLFVTVSRPATQGDEHLTFWGLGHHEYRDRWITDEWFYYAPNFNSETLKHKLHHDTARESIQQRRDEIAVEAKSTQSTAGALFEMLADLTDDDGAIADIEDLGFMLDDCDDAE